MNKTLKQTVLIGSAFSVGLIAGGALVLSLLQKSRFSEVASAWVIASSQLVDEKGQVRSQEDAAMLSFSNFVSLTPIIGANFALATPPHQEQIQTKAKAIVQHWDALSQRETLVVMPEEAKPHLDCITQGRLDDGGAGIQACSQSVHQRLNSERAPTALTALP